MDADERSKEERERRPPTGQLPAARRAGARWAKAVAIGCAAWLVPGLGHWLLGRRRKGLFFLVTIWGTFLTGWALSDFRAVFWKYDRIATYGQLGMGLPTVALLAAKEPISSALGRTFYEPTGPSENLLSHYDVGTLYTCVAGLLNVVVVLSAVGLALWAGARKPDAGGEPADSATGARRAASAERASETGGAARV